MFAITRLPLTAIILATSLVGVPTLAQNSVTSPPADSGPATQPPIGPRQGPGYGMGPGMMAGSWTMDRDLASLKTELHITQTQEAAWKAYADIVSGVGEQLRALHQKMFEAMGTASWEERRGLMNEMFQTRQRALDTVHAAAVKLGAVLDPTQTAEAQRDLPGLGYGPGMMGGYGYCAGPRTSP
jgi:hypothetical protein